MQAVLRSLRLTVGLSLPLSACAGGPSPAPPSLAPSASPDAPVADPAAGGPVGGVPVPALLAAAASLPEAGLLQLSFPEAGLVYRLDADGRYWTGPLAGPLQVEKPSVRGHPGVDRAPAAALDRLRAELLALPKLPVAPPAPPPAERARPGGGREQRVPIVLGFFKDDVEQRVLVWADPRVSASFGPVAPLYVAFDEAALGGWMNE